MTITIEQLDDRVMRLEANEEGLRAEFRETLGTMHEVMAVHKATGGVLSALRITQLEQSKKLQEHSFLLVGLVDGQKRLEGEVSGLKQGQARLEGEVSGLKQGQARLEGEVSGLKQGQARLEGEVSG
ncbi:hypothetical protein, partial [Allorhizocola rhizosphaerae]|uniref:hypothetical protein n=1 Tax=Allorhizocola rhizosphaerae TaxID=1872709 RepID=UPI001B8AEE43